jgi:hypothetical protein
MYLCLLAFIFSFTWSTSDGHYESGTVLGAEDTQGNKTQSLFSGNSEKKEDNGDVNKQMRKSKFKHQLSANISAALCKVLFCLLPSPNYTM